MSFTICCPCRWNQRVRVIVTTDDDQPVASVHKIWPVATWWEREAWDLFGIVFSGQPDLRRILTDYGFEGHPMRKDFPLTGYVEVRYDEDRKAVVYEPVKLTQDLRSSISSRRGKASPRCRATRRCTPNALEDIKTKPPTPTNPPKA